MTQGPTGKLEVHRPISNTVGTGFEAHALIAKTARNHALKGRYQIGHAHKDCRPSMQHELAAVIHVANFRFAVAVVKGSNIVGHVPMEYSRVFWYFIQKRPSSIVCKIGGSRGLS